MIPDTTKYKQMKRELGLDELPTSFTYDCRLAIREEGPLAYTWQEKPGTVVSHLCEIVEDQHARIQRLEDVLEKGYAQYGASKTEMYAIMRLLEENLLEEAKEKIASIIKSF